MTKVKRKKKNRPGAEGRRKAMKAFYNEQAKIERARIKAMSPEEKIAHDEEKAQRKKWKELDRLEAKANKEKKAKVQREAKVLRYMLKTDVLYSHHGREDSLKEQIKTQLTIVKEDQDWSVYESYLWNYRDTNHNSRCLLGRLWSGTREFETIYDVPLDGTYVFYTTDSGQRGLGVYDYMHAKKVEETTVVPKVNPGAFPPITHR